MASLRKRYADRIEVGPRRDEPPVTTMPQETAAQPPPAVDAKPPPEMPETAT